MICAMYLRKSRAEELSASMDDTLRLHKKLLCTYAQKNNLTISKTYEEVISGESLFARPQMLKLLNEVQNGRFDAVLCMDLDRLGRGGMQDQGIIIDTFKNANKTELKTFISRREYKIINKRLRRGLNDTITSGGYVPNAPYGYLKCVQNRRPTLSINEEEAKFVRMIFKMYTEGFGASAIAQTVNSMGAKPHRSSEFHRNSIRFILRNPVYTGKILWNRQKYYTENNKRRSKPEPEKNWLIVDGIHPPIIDEATFNEVQEILGRNHIPPSSSREIKNPLAGILKCRNCGKNMQRIVMGGIPYITCGTKSCVSSSRLQYIEELLIQKLMLICNNVNLKKYRVLNSRLSDYEHIKSSIYSELKKNKSQKERIYELLENGTYNTETFNERIKRVLEKFNVLSKQLDETNKELQNIKSAENKLSDTEIKSISAVYSSASPKNKNLILKAVVSHIEYFKGKKTKPKNFSVTIFYHSF